jgi:hypothetical protein
MNAEPGAFSGLVAAGDPGVVAPVTPAGLAAGIQATAASAGEPSGPSNMLSPCTHNNCWLKYATLLYSHFLVSIHYNIKPLVQLISIFLMI